VFSGTVPHPGDIGLTVRRSNYTPSGSGASAFGGGIRLDVAQRHYAGRLQVRLHLPPPPNANAIPGVAIAWKGRGVLPEPGLWDPTANEVVFWVEEPFGAQRHDWFAAWWDPARWAKAIVLDPSFEWIDHLVGHDPRLCTPAYLPWALLSSPDYRVDQFDEPQAFRSCLRQLAPSGGTDRLEVLLASTMDALQLLDVPDDAAVRVEGQPRWLQELLPRLVAASQSDVVTIGEQSAHVILGRQKDDALFQFRSRQTWPLLVANLVSGIFGALNGRNLEAVLMTTASCFARNRPVFPDPHELESGALAAKTPLNATIRCTLDLAAHPRAALSAFTRLLTSVSANERRAFVADLRRSLRAITPTARRVASVLKVDGQHGQETFLQSDTLDDIDAVAVQLDGIGRRSLDLRRAARCYNPCWISGRVHLRHPAWGETTLVTTRSADPDHPDSYIKAIDDKGRVRWSSNVAGYEALAPAGVEPNQTEPAVDSPQDATGNVFINYNPGRYNGVIVLRPTAADFENFGSLPASGDYAAPWYGADVVDRNHDGVFEIEETVYCHPECTARGDTIVTYSWNGRGYVKTSQRFDGLNNG
jgi:hypothetical protein